MEIEANPDANRGTVLEPVEDIRAALGGGLPAATRIEPRPDPGEPAADAGQGPTELPHRPVLRPSVPELVVLDDGEQESGEVHRLRAGVTLIGRVEGQIQLPHDALVSSRHAEIVREGAGRSCRWLLRDLGSANGTFVRCGRSLLQPESLLILGSRRFRFQPPSPPVGEAGPPGQPGRTLAIDMAVERAGWCPSLIETGQAQGGLELRLDREELSLGRPGVGNRLAIDDPLLAAHHARIIRDAAGRWLIEAHPSRNGVWVQVAAVHLTSRCWFQVGEQRFLFAVSGAA